MSAQQRFRHGGGHSDMVHLFFLSFLVAITFLYSYGFEVPLYYLTPMSLHPPQPYPTPTQEHIGQGYPPQPYPQHYHGSTVDEENAMPRMPPQASKVLERMQHIL
jgi:hypothetical protein